MKEFVCIICPKGCHLTIDDEQDYQVHGNACQRGATYGKKECTHPTRMLTSTIRIVGAAHPRVSVRTSCDVPKACINEIMQRLNTMEVEAPVHRGDIIEYQIYGTDANLIITKDLKKIIS